jgi:hypothetical protein
MKNIIPICLCLAAGATFLSGNGISRHELAAAVPDSVASTAGVAEVNDVQPVELTPPPALLKEFETTDDGFQKEGTNFNVTTDVGEGGHDAVSIALPVSMPATYVTYGGTCGPNGCYAPQRVRYAAAPQTHQRRFRPIRRLFGR